MKEERTYYRRKLPHYQPPNATYFITFRLAGSLPTEVIAKLKEEYTAEEKRLRSIRDLTAKVGELRTHAKRYFLMFDVILDQCCHGPTWLRDERIAKIVSDAIHHRDGQDFEVIAYCIMPNHVHLVISMIENVEQTSVCSDSPTDNVEQTSVCSNDNDRTEVRSTAPYQKYKLIKILRELKGSTAREANKILNRSGAFWQHESFDHVVRDGRELERIVLYVLNNPVKAGLVTEWESWRWSFGKYDVEE